MDTMVSAALEDPYEVVAGDLTLHLLTHDVFLKGEQVPLSPFEYRVIEYLVLRKGVPISGSQLARDLTKPDDRCIKNSLGMTMKRLRTKLQKVPDYIPMVSNREGYVLYKPKTVPA